MDFARIDAHLLSHPGASRAFHERWGWMVYWVGGRQFACEFVASPTAPERRPRVRRYPARARSASTASSDAARSRLSPMGDTSIVTAEDPS